jgi:hypothetical protein
MAKKTSPAAVRKAALETPDLEKYEVVEIHRSKLVDAPYNPRILPDKAKDKLKAGIKKIGLLAPPVWNARTGHIVSGHQRLSIMDGLKGTDDYTLKVAKVDLDDVQEKEANLLMNNPEAQGEWDLEKLEEMLHTDGLALDGTGFDAADVYRLFGDAPMQQNDIDELAQRLEVAKQSYEDVQTISQERDGEEFYIVVVFKDGADRTSFLTDLGMDDNRFQDGRTLRKLCAAAGSLPEANIPDTKVVDPAQQLELRNATRRELGKLREVARHALEGKQCFFCHLPLLPADVFKGHKAGDSRGKPLPEVEDITEHHIDGNHDNNAIENRVYTHGTCHKKHHASLPWGNANNGIPREGEDGEAVADEAPAPKKKGRKAA